MKLSPVAVGIIAITSLLSAAGARAAPPVDAKPAWAPWFKSLQRPDVGGSCCSQTSDCRTTDFRMSGGHYEARYRDGWLVVPESKVIHRNDNPTGRAVLCADGRGRKITIFCFVPGAQS